MNHKLDKLGQIVNVGDNVIYCDTDGESLHLNFAQIRRLTPTGTTLTKGEVNKKGYVRSFYCNDNAYIKIPENARIGDVDEKDINTKKKLIKLKYESGESLTEDDWKILIDDL